MKKEILLFLFWIFALNWLFISGMERFDGFSKHGSPFKFENISLFFIENKGQVSEEVFYYAKGGSYTVWLTKNALLFDMVKGEERMSKGNGVIPSFSRSIIRMKFLKTEENFRIDGKERLNYKVNYYNGNKRRGRVENIPVTRAVEYRNLYKNIDMKIYGLGNQIKYDFVVNHGGNPEDILFEFEGAERIRIDDEGNIIADTNSGSITFKTPFAYQEGGREVAIKFKKISKKKFGFETGNYDRGKTLIIDPPVIIFSTYIGGKNDDFGYSVTMDSSGFLYITGSTFSTDFPIANSYQGANAGSPDIFITKISPDGGSLIYSTYLGGSKDDIGYSIAVDSEGYAYITGQTRSGDFPLINAYQGYNSGSWDSFLTKLSPEGSIIYSTYIGGSRDDLAYSIRVDSSGNAYIAGTTNSLNFPVRKAFQNSIASSWDIFVTKISPDGGSLIYSTYLGGSKDDIGYSIAVDSEGYAYITGRTSSGDFPLKNAYQGSNAGLWDVFLTKLSADGSFLIYSTYLGGSFYDYGYSVAVDLSGSAYVTGRTYSEDFPLKNPFRQKNSGSWDVFVTKFSKEGNSLVYSTYIGGTDDDFGYSIVVDSYNYAYITGITASEDFPVLNPYQEKNGGSWDAFLTKLSPDGSFLIYSTYIGGQKYEYGNSLTIDSSGFVYITGWTASSDFPVQNPLQSSNAGSCDVFLAKIFGQEEIDLSVEKSVDNLFPSLGDFVTFTVTVKNNGPFLAKLIRIEERLPDGLDYSSHITSNGIYNPSTGIWDIKNLAKDEASTLSLTVRVSKLGYIKNTASLISSDPPDLNNSNNNASASITQENPDFSDSTSNYQKADRIVARRGDVINFYIYYKNKGGEATGVVVTETVDKHLEIVEIGGEGELSDNKITWKIGNVAKGSSGNLSFRAIVKDGAPVGIKIINTAVIDCEQTEPFDLNKVIITVLHGIGR
ncbi:MAG: SBBP repeat-containing protein [Candidatus Aminicenantia bacterium]